MLWLFRSNDNGDEQLQMIRKTNAQQILSSKKAVLLDFVGHCIQSENCLSVILDCAGDIKQSMLILGIDNYPLSDNYNLIITKNQLRIIKK